MKLIPVFSAILILGCSLLLSCSNNDTEVKKKELELKEKELQQNKSATSGDSLKSQTSNDEKSKESYGLIEILFQNGMPIQLQKAKSILGDNVKYKKAEEEATFDDYIWEFSDGTILTFSDINYNESGIELDVLVISTKTKNIIRCPLSVAINQSSLSDCKKAVPSLQKGIVERTYKFEKDKVWYYFVFNEYNILNEVKLAGWDTETTG